VKEQIFAALDALRAAPQSVVFCLIGAVVFVVDQMTKWWAVGALTDAFASLMGPNGLGFWQKLDRFLWLRHPGRVREVAVLENFWHFRYVENPGSAWGFLSGSASELRTPFFLLVSAAAMVFIVVYFQRTAKTQLWLRTALVLVFAGALGNFVDRARFGYVVDFVEWHWYAKASWPVFNVADASISSGVVMMVLEMFFTRSVRGAKADSAGGGV
jgi:signal peptidase II